MSSRSHDDDLSSLLRGAADAVGRLFASHLKVARLELTVDARALGRHAALAACFAALASIGYLLVTLGLAALLQPALGWGPALLGLGALHLVGGIAALVTIRPLEPLAHTARAVGATATALRAIERVPAAAEAERAP